MAGKTVFSFCLILFSWVTLTLAGGGGKNICSEPAGVTGMCRGYFPRWTYSADEGKCVSFIYGGCGGSRNNFETEQACIDTCCSCRGA